MSELATKMTCDPSDFTAGMTKSRDELAKTTTVIVQQQSAWAQVASSAITASASLAGTAANIYIETKRASAEMTRFVVSATLAGAAIVGFGNSQAVTGAAIAAGTGYLIYHHSWLLKLVGLAVPGMGQVAATVGLAITAYKTLDFVLSEITASYRGSIDGTRDSILGYNQLHGASRRLSESLSQLGTSIAQPFRDGTAAVISYVASFSPLPTLAGLTASAFDGVASAANYVTNGLKSATSVGVTTAFILATGASHEASAAFVEQGTSLAKLSAQTTAFIGKQEAAREGFKNISRIQEQATQSAANAAEVAKVSSLMTVEAIDQQVASLREKSAATLMAGKGDKAWESQTNSLFVALAKQRQGLIDGTITDKAAEESKRALAKATEDAAKAAADAAQKELQLQLQGASKVESLKDQIDQLNGSASHAEIAMREMWRAGASQSQIEEVGKLTEELDRLKQEEADGKKQSKSPKAGATSASAALFGSAEAARIMLGSVGGTGKSEELQAKQIAATLRVEAAIKSQAEPQLMAGSFGPGGTVG